jgi:hypothetical protein
VWFDGREDGARLLRLKLAFASKNNVWYEAQSRVKANEMIAIPPLPPLPELKTALSRAYGGYYVAVRASVKPQLMGWVW